MNYVNCHLSLGNVNVPIVYSSDNNCICINLLLVEKSFFLLQMVSVWYNILRQLLVFDSVCFKLAKSRVGLYFIFKWKYFIRVFATTYVILSAICLVFVLKFVKLLCFLLVVYSRLLYLLILFQFSDSVCFKLLNISSASKCISVSASFWICGSKNLKDYVPFLSKCSITCRLVPLS